MEMTTPDPSPWDEPLEVCRYCGKLKEFHQKYGWAWLCPPSVGTSTTSTTYAPVPQFTIEERKP